MKFKNENKKKDYKTSKPTKQILPRSRGSKLDVTSPVSNRDSDFTSAPGHSNPFNADCRRLSRRLWASLCEHVSLAIARTYSWSIKAPFGIKDTKIVDFKCIITRAVTYSSGFVKLGGLCGLEGG